MDKVIERALCHFDNRPLIVKAWIPDMEFARDELNTVSI